MANLSPEERAALEALLAVLHAPAPPMRYAGRGARDWLRMRAARAVGFACISLAVDLWRLGASFDTYTRWLGAGLSWSQRIGRGLWVPA